MIEEILKDYYLSHADFIIINRASSYYPVLLKNTSNNFTFQCKGTQKAPYRIQVKLKKNLDVSTSCSCPYEGGGICKHQVASVKQLIKLLKKDQLKINLNQLTNTHKKSKALSLPHKNGVIDREKLRNIIFDHNRSYYGDLNIKSVSDNEIKGEYDSFIDQHFLEFIYTKANDQIKVSCTCNGSSRCYHKYLFLNAIKEKFGLDYFSPDHLEKLKAKKLKEVNLLNKVDFDDVYNLKIKKEGIEIKEKKKNLFESPKSIYDPSMIKKKKELYQPIPSSDEAAYALSFCLQFADNELIDFFPIYGKLNKQKDQISSKIEPINSNNLDKVLSLIRKEDLNLLPLAKEISSQFDAVKNDPESQRRLSILIQIFKKLRDFFSGDIYLQDRNNKLVKKYLQPIQITAERINPILDITTDDRFFKLSFKVKIRTKKYQLDSKEILITPLGIILENQLIPIENPSSLNALLKLKDSGSITILNQGDEHLKKEVIEPYSKLFDINYKGIKEQKTKDKHVALVKQVYLSDADEGEYVVFQPIIKYGNQQVEPDSAEKIWLDEDKLISLKRSREKEREFLTFIQSLHANFEGKSHYFYIQTEDALQSFWLINAIDQLQQENVQVFGLNNLKHIKYNLNKPTVNTGLSSDIDWFDMDLDIKFGDQKLDLQRFQKAIVKNSNYVELKDGSIGVLPDEWIKKYKKYFQIGQIKKEKIRISNYNFNIIDDLYENLEHQPEFLKDLYKRKQRILHLKNLKKVKPSKKLNATLRPYQKEGLSWMVFLDDNQLGGCLADDMGLGKTLQSIAFLQYLKDKNKNDQPSLVIGPTSLIFNWIKEFERFAPDLKTLTFKGNKRNELKSQFADVDVVLTTYGSLVKDIEFHKKQTYNYVILDESQAIKNPNSQRFKAARLLNCKNRLALTGTPIENNTFDLYSQFNFLNPGIFGSVKHFRKTFSDAIDKEQNEDASNLLSNMIKPFILRRTKKQVATELPDKTEAVIYCEMEKDQRQVYNAYKKHFRDKLKEQIENEGVNKSQMYILQGLTKMRQICNSTYLADKEKDYGNHSAKLDELTRHLNEKVSDHKVLIFSQFVEMLHLVKKRLQKEKIKFEYLDGQTKDREEKVDNFQKNNNIRVFLISLKAGGTGLNLTEADYVYLIDPWWNPAVENQAIDRCYRIGQNKKVLAYRMICKNSIEEKIVALQNKKKTVASDVIRTDFEKKSFDKKDLQHFFGD